MVWRFRRFGEQALHTSPIIVVQVNSAGVREVKRGNAIGMKTLPKVFCSKAKEQSFFAGLHDPRRRALNRVQCDY